MTQRRNDNKLKVCEALTSKKVIILHSALEQKLAQG